MSMSIKGYTVLKDGFYTIVINANLCEATRRKTYKHEYEHIINGDFEKRASADLIEVIAHGR
jgi:hypothetical protein